jgi:two-component system, sensor histidine kinase RegB
MSTVTNGFEVDGVQTNWVRLRTLILLRWMAIAGQIAAILAASQIYGLNLPLGLCSLAIGLSILVTSSW